MNNDQRVKMSRMGFSVPTSLPGRAPTGMKKLVYKPEYDDPALARAKAKKRKATAKKTTTGRKSSARKRA